MEEGNFQGDLADVVRASGGCGMARDVASSSFPPLEVPLNMVEMSDGLFGDPFSSMRDPLQGIGHVDMSTMLPPHQFRISTTTSTILDHQTQNRIHIPDDQMRINSTLVCDMPARVLNPSSPKQAPSFIDTTARVQMSSPPTNPTLKRRKSQPKKVVCIPAPTAINSRQGGGEVVPSDLWAWRKYGQKPIKGSPYPRGYYRCSSSKGCSARKQVERSRTDPNMLVITYTSEHNHPWPTQRNALAGSSRISAAPVPTTSSPLLTQPNKTANVKEEITDAHQTLVSNDDSFTNGTDSNSSVKRDQETIVNGMIGIYEANRVEAEDHGKGVVPNQLMMNDLVIDYERSYRPVMMQEDHNLAAVDGDGDDQDFFADLRELEADPLNDLLFSRRGGNKSMLDGDPFGCLFDWQSNSNPTTTTTTTTNTNTHNRSPHQNS